MTLHIAQDPDADRVLTEQPFALLMGMMLDQQFPMECALAGPAKVLDRFGTLDPSAIAGADPEEFAALCAGPPGVHRFPGSMAARIQQLARIVGDEYDGQADRLWTEAGSGKELMRRLQALPGFGRRKDQSFTALLADVVGATSLELVRAFKKEKKRSPIVRRQRGHLGEPGEL